MFAKNIFCKKYIDETVTHWVIYICSSSWLLANKSRDLSQVEKKITVVKADQIHKMTIIFTQNGQKLSF
jgi:hypothetical protein